MEQTVPALRLATEREAPLAEGGEHVLYWMIGARRTRYNFALDRAIELARRLERPLVVLEALRLDYPWASERLHRFVVEGMADNAAAFADSPVRHYPYVERRQGEGRGLLEALAARACAVVTDEVPTFFLPRMVRAAAGRLPVRLEAVDSNGLLPLRAAERAYPTAHGFRRLLQRRLPEHLAQTPKASPLRGLRLPPLRSLPAEVTRRWPEASADELARPWELLGGLALDRAVPAVPFRGGGSEAREALRRFLDEGLPRYAAGSNHPDDDCTSGLSPWLHFGHLSSHEVFAELAADEGWTEADLAEHAHGRRQGWWGMGESAEAFLDQLVTWRELGFGVTYHRDDHARYEALPEWARTTLEEHEGDPRSHLYELEQLEDAQTHDPLWNAAQRQLRVQGRIHGYLRMLWGKKILEWSPSPRVALDTMIHLNDRWAIDGRDPNSISGIFWVLGRHDRAWGPERPIFGKVRYMSTASARKKLRLRAYLSRWSNEETS